MVFAFTAWIAKIRTALRARLQCWGSEEFTKFISQKHVSNNEMPINVPWRCGFQIKFSETLPYS